MFVNPKCASRETIELCERNRPHQPSFSLSMNPKGIPASSPGLRGTSYPGLARKQSTNPNGVVARFSRTGRNPVGVDDPGYLKPKVARASQPWAERYNPFRIGRSTQPRSLVYDPHLKNNREPENPVPGAGALIGFAASCRTQPLSTRSGRSRDIVHRRAVSWPVILWTAAA
jgi:hypothetical protein